MQNNRRKSRKLLGKVVRKRLISPKDAAKLKKIKTKCLPADVALQIRRLRWQILKMKIMIVAVVSPWVYD